MKVLAIWIDGIHAAELRVSPGLGYTLEYTAAWSAHEYAYPLSPHLPLHVVSGGAEVKNFFENLLPEGASLEVAASMHNLSKHDAFGLLAKLGRETAGALTILPSAEAYDTQAGLRPLALPEISQRIHERPHISFSVWDSKMRLSIAGCQDKLAVYQDEGGAWYLPNGSASSTHLIKPENVNPQFAWMPANEHFCRRLARELKLPVPAVRLRHIPDAIYEVERYDRTKGVDGQVQRLHQIDLCQVLNLSVEMKYQQAYEFSPVGASYADLFQAAQSTINPVKSKMDILRWAVFNYLIGNTDAHAKNISFFLDQGGLRLAPFYDLVSGSIYGLKKLALFIGSEEELNLVTVMDWAEFCKSGHLHPKLLAAELKAQAQNWKKFSPVLLEAAVYSADEKQFLARLAADIESRVSLMREQAVGLQKI